MGPMMSGPAAKPRTKIEMMKEAMLAFVEEKSLMNSGTAGAKMEDAKGVSRVREDITKTFFHFLRAGQFMGFWGSEGESQSMMLGSSGERAESAGAGDVDVSIAFSTSDRQEMVGMVVAWVSLVCDGGQSFSPMLVLEGMLAVFVMS
jgi:hypothetical protein